MNGLKFVFCEGKDDVAVIRGLAQSSGIPDLTIEAFNGKDNLQNFLRVLQDRPEFAQNQVGSIGIVRDADDDAGAAFQSVREALLARGFAAPEASGTVLDKAIKVGVLIIGLNDGRGVLEDLCLKSVSDRPEFGCVEEYFRCVAEKSGRKTFSSKARVRAWLATHTEYEAYIGRAAKAGYWPWDSPAFDSLRRFLAAL